MQSHTEFNHHVTMQLEFDGGAVNSVFNNDFHAQY
jgi:hypothetical protein